MTLNIQAVFGAVPEEYKRQSWVESGEWHTASSLVGGGEWMWKGEVFPLSGKCFSGLDHQDLLACISMYWQLSTD